MLKIIKKNRIEKDICFCIKTHISPLNNFEFIKNYKYYADYHYMINGQRYIAVRDTSSSGAISNGTLHIMEPKEFYRCFRKR